MKILKGLVLKRTGVLVCGVRTLKIDSIGLLTLVRLVLVLLLLVEAGKSIPVPFHMVIQVSPWY